MFYVNTILHNKYCVINVISVSTIYKHLTKLFLEKVAWSKRVDYLRELSKLLKLFFKYEC